MAPPLPPHLARILDLARWAPSGDNTQPWRFEVLTEDHVLVHGFDTRDHVVYDLDGHASQLAHGALLETMSIAASQEGRLVDVSRRSDTPETHLQYDVRFSESAAVRADPLVAEIERRVVQRRPLSTRPLAHEQKIALEAALPAGYRVIFFEGLAQRWRLARFMFDNAKVRLTIPEAYEVHKSVIEWGARYSEDRIPEQAVGVDPATAKLMRWVMGNWSRVRFFNTWLMGTLAPRIQLDLLPGIGCAAHVALLAPENLHGPDDYAAAGRAMQRFWLTVAQQGLYLQPEMTPLIFTRYSRQGRTFTTNRVATNQVARLNGELSSLVGGQNLEKAFFMARVGSGRPPWARSTRKPLVTLFTTGTGNKAL